MTRITLSMAVMALLVGCEPTAEISEPGGGRGSTTPTTGTTSAQLVGDPFLPSLSPHRLAVGSDRVLVSDPEGAASDGRRPMVHVLQLSSGVRLASLVLPDGANPGAIEVDASDRKGYVVAQGLGGVYSIDLATAQLGKFIPTCAAPIDLAISAGTVKVACRGGEVVTLFEGTVQRAFVAANLTAITVNAQGRVVVATAEAKLFEVGATAGVTPQPVMLHDVRARSLVPNTARRLVSVAQGPVAMLFQQSIDGELSSDKGSGVVPGQNGGGGYGGDGSGCSIPAARPALVGLTPGGSLGESHGSQVALAVDLAASPDGKTLAVADGSGGTVELTPVTTLTTPSSTSGAPGCAMGLPTFDNAGLPPNQIQVPAPMALAWVSDGRLLVLNGSPNLEVRVLSGPTFATAQTISIRPRQVPDGFTLFHSRPNPAPLGVPVGLSGGGSITCASCHPDGLSNGAVTTLAGVTHKVMPLAGRLSTATQMHWDAKPFHEAIVAGTWQTQMGGAPLSTARELALHSYLSQLKAPRGVELDAAQLEAGQAAFAKADCAACHLASRGFTNDATADVGKGMHKVPSLTGLAYTAPYMSDGCAATLEQRFDNVGCGGGELHGKPSRLDATERAALIRYLKSL